MTATQTWIGNARQAAHLLGAHPKDEGWRGLYRVIAAGLESETGPLARVLTSYFESCKEAGDPAHAISMLGFAIKMSAPDLLPILARHEDGRRKLALLDEVVADSSDSICEILRTRRNSFTSPRRFVIAQVLFSAYFHTSGVSARVLDIGTGLGIFPGELNCRRAYEAFSVDMTWPCARQPTYRDVPVDARMGIDRHPFPDLEWVRACYGDFPYYDGLFGELMWAANLPEVRSTQVDLIELDICDADDLADLILRNKINAINCSYVLYELSEADRRRVLATLLECLPTPGLLIVTDPRKEFGYRGAVTLFQQGEPAGIELVVLSNRHTLGKLLPGSGFQSFASRYLSDWYE